MEAVSQCTPQLGPDMSNWSKIAAQRLGYKRQGKKNQPHLVISNLPQNTNENVLDAARLRTQARPMLGKTAQHGANSAAPLIWSQLFQPTQRKTF